ncbi:MAG: hypothetical protein KA753_08645 [Paludibacter sp.]|nr:hypothetical protein [Paludibacter sp.]
MKNRIYNHHHVRMPFVWLLGRIPFVLLSCTNTVCMGIRANAIRIIIMTEYRLHGYSGEYNSPLRFTIPR